MNAGKTGSVERATYLREHVRGRRAAFRQHKEQIGCQRCGYAACGWALDYHHPGEKGFHIRADNWRTERGKREMERCILLCSNCHAEEHFKEMQDGW